LVDSMRFSMDRLFTFGCSFTKYCWPTWADILAQSAEHYENWATPGGGNQYIFNSLIECHKRNSLTANDTVIIMWTSISREDRYIRDKGWLTPGSIFNQTDYDKNFVKNLADPYGYLIRDLAIISATRMILDQIGCQWHFLSMVPIEYHDDSTYFKKDLKITKEIKDLYQIELDLIKPSVFDTVFNGDWSSRKHLKPQVDDNHPTPGEHLIYLNTILPQYNISNDTVNLVKLSDQIVLDNLPFDWQGWKLNQLGMRF